MDCSFSRVPNIAIKWILCFYCEYESVTKDTVLCDNLEDVNLVNVFNALSEDTIRSKMLTEFIIDDYDAINDPLNVLRSSMGQHSNDIMRTENKRESAEKMDVDNIKSTYDASTSNSKNEPASVEQMDTKYDECIYRTIQIPVTKSLFMKVANLKVVNNEEFFDTELYDVVNQLLIFIHDKLPFLRILAQRLLDDPELYNKLNAIDDEKRNRNKKSRPLENQSFDIKLQNAICEIQNSFNISTTDKFGNAAISAQDSNSRPLFHVDVYSLDYFFKPCYIRMDGYFMINNHEILSSMYERVSSSFSLTIDIDFADLFYEARRNSTKKKYSDKEIVAKLNEAFAYGFFKLACLKVCILRLMGIQSNLDFKVISTKKLHIYYRKCVFNNSTQLPLNLKVLSITESKICCNLILSDTLEAITLERTVIMEHHELKIGDSCRKIQTTDNTGVIHVPYLERTFNIECQTFWSIKLLRCEEIFEELIVSDIILFEGTETVLPSNIRKITFRNITLDDQTTLVFPKDVEEITLKNFKGRACFEGFTYESLTVFFISKGEFHSKKMKEYNGMINFMICNAFITKSTQFLPTISTVHMTCVCTHSISILELNETIEEFSINNCIDHVNFDGAHYFEVIELGISEHEFDDSEQHLHFKRIDAKRTGSLFLSNLEVHKTIHFGPDIEKLELCDVTVSELSYITVNENFEMIKITNCKGHFIIPGIFSDRESRALHMVDYNCYFEITKTKKGSFDIFMNSLKFDRLVIEMDIDTAKFNQITITESLLINSQQCKNLVLDSLLGRLLIPSIASFNELKLFNLQKLYMSYKVALPIEQASAMQNTPMSGDQNIIVLDSSVNIHIPTIENNCFENICVSKCSFHIDIANVLINVITNVCLFRVVSESEFYLINHKSKKFSKLKLVNNRICGTWRLENDVGFLSLVGTTSDEGSTLQLNKNLESIRVDSSQIRVDATNTRNLKAITIINSTSIVYDPSIHFTLSYLSISTVNINFGLDLVPSLDTFLLTDSILAPGTAIKINENISYLSLCNSAGIIDMKGVAGLGIIQFNRQHALLLDRHAGGNDECLLYIENYILKHDIAVSNDIQTVHLKNVEAKQDAKLILARGCKSLKLDSSRVVIDTSQATHWEKLTLKNMKPLISGSLLVVPSTIKTLILLNTVITGGFTLPIHISTVILREVRLANSYILKFNQECRKVRFYHCSGEYDLSGIQKLEVLGLVPELKGTLELKVSLPSLDNVRKLDIAYNLNEDCLKYCLARYINLESLAVRSIDYREKCPPYPRLSLVKSDVFNSSNMNAWLIQKISEYELPREHLDNETANLLNIKMNIFLNELFIFNVKNKLKCLKLIGCGLSGGNMKMLKEFVNLQTLIVDSAFIDNKSIKNIPCQLETLEIIDRDIYEDLFINLCKLDWKTVQLLRKHEGIKHLVLDKSIMEYEHIFNCLPVQLESLKFKNFTEYDIDFHAQNKKIIVKRLVLLLDDPNTNPLMIIDNNPMVRQYYKFFDLLQNHIDFTKLEDLALETPTKSVGLDRKTYRIK